MNAHTHILGGLAAAGLVLSVGFVHPLTVIVASGFGGLVPDWDHPGSTVGRWVPWPAISRSRGPAIPPEVGRAGWPHPIWHRHQAHSLVGLVIADGLFTGIGYGLFRLLAPMGRAVGGIGHYPWPWILFGLMMGGLSHLVLDGFNESRQWWFWPFTQRGFRWPVHSSVRRTDFWAFILLLGLVGLLAWHLQHTGLWFHWLGAHKMS